MLMETTVRVSNTGQIIIPPKILTKLDLNNGGNITFVEIDDKIILQNPKKSLVEESLKALDEIIEGFKGEAERLGLKDEEDTNKIVDEVRAEMWEKLYANND